jgi:hypothetical protein
LVEKVKNEEKKRIFSASGLEREVIGRNGWPIFKYCTPNKKNPHNSLSYKGLCFLIVAPRGIEPLFPG